MLCLLFMMRRQIVAYLLATLVSVVFISANPVLGAVAENSDLVKLVSQYNDPHMTVKDLAFFLATHNYDAIPKESYVEVAIEGTIYKAVPNSTTGLADLAIMD